MSASRGESDGAAVVAWRHVYARSVERMRRILSEIESCARRSGCRSDEGCLYVSNVMLRACGCFDALSFRVTMVNRASAI
jgi:hypothetical protein